MGITNLMGELAKQKYPGNHLWDYLRALKFIDILKQFGHKPTEYLKIIIRMEKYTSELGIVEDSEPDDTTKLDYFWRSFCLEGREWFDETDNNGDNEWTEMSRQAIAARMDCFYRNQVKEA